MKASVSRIVIALTILINAFILGNSYKYKLISTETIVLTGLAEKDFISDQIVWKGQYSRSGYDLKEAYTQIKSDEAVIKSYLKEKGLPDSNMFFLAVDVVKNVNYANGPNGTSKSVFSVYL